MKINELATEIGKSCTFGTRLVYFGLGVVGFFAPGWATATAMRAVMAVFVNAAPMNTWPRLTEELFSDD